MIGRLDLAELLTGADTEPPWLVQDLLCQGDMIVLVGAPAAGKSLLAYTLAIATASGHDFLGKPVARQRVLYLDVENAPVHRRRYLRWAWHGLGRPPLDQLTRWLHVVDPHWYGQQLPWWQGVRAAANDCQPGLVIVDTATPACHIQDENDNGEASQAIHHLRAALPDGATLLVLKHARKDDRGRWALRGAKTWMGEADAVLRLARTKGKGRGARMHGTTLRGMKTRSAGLFDQAVRIVPRRALDDPEGWALDATWPAPNV